MKADDGMAREDSRMLNTFKELIANQYEATLCTLNMCIDRCPEVNWTAPVAKYKFCQVAFHTLIFTDLYLGHDEESLYRQPFHHDNKSVFRDYEEFKDRAPVLLYDRSWIKTYLQHCRSKASEVMAGETAETLSARSGFDWLPFPRGELHIYNLRHIQHHSAQLILRLRLDRNLDFPWMKSGWRELPAVREPATLAE